jgi:hypothetical protein
MNRRCFLLIFAMAILCSACVSQYKVVVTFSPSLQGYFTEYPTIELDIAAVSDSEAGEVKQMGVENYFAPDSGIREQLQGQTCFFSREEDVRFILPSRAPVWFSWLLKKPTSLLVIGSLPHDSTMTATVEPRVLLVNMKKSYVFARTVYILVEPKKITQISRSQSKSKDKTQTYEQWVETR